jgi:hypothetical protein
MATMFQEADGATSMRRVLAAFFAVSAVALAVILPLIAGVSGWHVFIPCGACIFASLLLLFFTTWADVAAIISAAKGK